MFGWSSRFGWCCYLGGLVGDLQVIVEVVDVVGGFKSIAGEAVHFGAGGPPCVQLLDIDPPTSPFLFIC